MTVTVFQLTCNAECGLNRSPRVREEGLVGIEEVSMIDSGGMWGGSEVLFRSLMERGACLPSFRMKEDA